MRALSPRARPRAARARGALALCYVSPQRARSFVAWMAPKQATARGAVRRTHVPPAFAPRPGGAYPGLRRDAWYVCVPRERGQARKIPQQVSVARVAHTANDASAAHTGGVRAPRKTAGSPPGWTGAPLTRSQRAFQRLRWPGVLRSGRRRRPHMWGHISHQRPLSAPPHLRAAGHAASERCGCAAARQRRTVRAGRADKRSLHNRAWRSAAPTRARAARSRK